MYTNIGTPYVLLEKDQTTTGRTLAVYPMLNSSWTLKVQSSCCGSGYSHSLLYTTSRCHCGSDEIDNGHGWGASMDIQASNLSSGHWPLWIKFWFGLENAEFAKF